MSTNLKYKQSSKDCQAENNHTHKLPPFTGKIVAGLVIGAATAALGTFLYAHFATHPPRRRIYKNPGHFGLEFEDVKFVTEDGILLHGWLLPATTRPKAVVIVSHGYPANRQDMLAHAMILQKSGYTCLMFDFRAHGHSEGKISSAGGAETQDMTAALDYLETRADLKHLLVGVLGQSMGAAVAIITAAKDERIKAVVAEASYPHLQDALEARFRFVVGRASKLIAHPVKWWAQKWMNFEPLDVSPINDIGRIGPRAVLIIQGQQDLLVRWQDGAALYAAAQEPREIWLLKRAGHAACLKDSPAEYAKRITEFFDRHLGSQIDAKT